jgi:membrane-associated protease RseP (regulator of RpoE activity)
VYPSPGPQRPSPVIPDLPPLDPNDQYEQFVPPQPLPPPHGRLWVQLALFALTLVATTAIGALHYLSYSIEFSQINEALAGDTITQIASRPLFYVHGLWYSLTILAILGCHEMGHYVACLRYDVVATRPYFLPAPFTLTGTLGAFIRIKSRIPDRVALFDIGVAGPIAGFVVAVPALFIGLWLSRLDRLPEQMPEGFTLGEPLLFQFAQWLIWGPAAEGYALNIHPMAFAAWFGLLATALNLFPVSQLDGGHISYAVLGRRSTIVTIVMIGVAILLAFTSMSWIVWTVLLIAMIAAMGPHHPPTLDDERTLGRGRLVLAAVAMLILIVCFTPAPISELVASTP